MKEITINEFFMKKRDGFYVGIGVGFMLGFIIYAIFDFLNEFEKLAIRVCKLEASDNTPNSKIQNRRAVITVFASKGKLKEGVAEVVAWCEDIGSDLLKNAIHLQGRIARFLSEDQKGLLQYSDGNQEYNKLLDDLLSLTESVQE